MRKYFGTDGIRGKIEEDMDSKVCREFAYAYGYYIIKHNLPRVLFLGTDTRQSRDWMKSTICSALLDCGIDVIDLSIIPTGMMSYLVLHHEVGGGIMITASHNPPDMNGIKVFSEKGYKLSCEQEEEIEKYIEDKKLVISKDKGRLLSGRTYKREYIKGVCQLSSGYQGYKILLDCANGSAGVYAPTIFKHLGAEVIALHKGSSGVDINVDCGAVSPQNLFRQLVHYGADIGFAYDGDADRLVVVLQDGRVLDGDDLLYVFAKKEKVKGVVGTVMSNGGMIDALSREHIHCHLSPVGDRNVLMCMEENGCLLGAESSGHLCHKGYNLSCDGVMNSVYIGKYLLENKIILPKKYPMMMKSFELSSTEYVQAKMIDWSAFVEDKKKEGERILVRMSGTENKIRVMLEYDGEDMNSRFVELTEWVLQKVKGIS